MDNNHQTKYGVASFCHALRYFRRNGIMADNWQDNRCWQEKLFSKIEFDQWINVPSASTKKQFLAFKKYEASKPFHPDNLKFWVHIYPELEPVPGEEDSIIGIAVDVSERSLVVECPLEFGKILVNIDYRIKNGEADAVKAVTAVECVLTELEQRCQKSVQNFVKGKKDSEIKGQSLEQEVLGMKIDDFGTEIVKIFITLPVIEPISDNQASKSSNDSDDLERRGPFSSREQNELTFYQKIRQTISKSRKSILAILVILLVLLAGILWYNNTVDMDNGNSDGSKFTALKQQLSDDLTNKIKILEQQIVSIKNKKDININDLEKIQQELEMLKRSQYLKVEYFYRSGNNAELKSFANNTSLQLDDKYLIRLTPKQFGYVYVLQVDETGAIYWLHPTSTRPNPLQQGQTYYIPQQPEESVNPVNFILLDTSEKSGSKTIYCLTTLQPDLQLENIFKQFQAMQVNTWQSSFTQVQLINIANFISPTLLAELRQRLEKCQDCASKFIFIYQSQPKEKHDV